MDEVDGTETVTPVFCSIATHSLEHAAHADARATLARPATARGGTVPKQVVVCAVSAEHSAPTSRIHPPMAALPDVGGGGKRSDGDAAMGWTDQPSERVARRSWCFGALSSSICHCDRNRR